MHTRCRPRPRSVCLVTLLLAVGASQALAQAPLSLHEAVAQAEARAPDLLALHERERAAEASSRRAGELPDPELVLGIDNLTATGDQAFAVGADPMTMRKIGLRQRLPAAAKRAAERAGASAEVALRERGVEQGRRQLRQAVAAAWVDRWSSERALDLLDALRGDSELVLAATRQRVAAGGRADDVLAVRGLLLDIDDRKAALAAEREAAIADLARWLPETAGQPLAPALDFAKAPLSEARALALIDASEELLAFAAQDAKADAAIAAARAQKRPDISLMAGYGQRAAGRDDMITLEVGIDLPLFPGRRQDHDILASLAARDALQAEQETARRALAARIRSEYAQWAALNQQLARDEHERLPLLRDRVALALAGWQSGAPLTPWLDARREEIEAELARAERARARGRLWARLAWRYSEKEIAQ